MSRIVKVVRNRGPLIGLIFTFYSVFHADSHGDNCFFFRKLITVARMFFVQIQPREKLIAFLFLNQLSGIFIIEQPMKIA